MNLFETLKTYLSTAVSDADVSQQVADTIVAIATATTEISALVRRGRLAGNLGASRGDNADGDGDGDALMVAFDPLDGSSNIDTNTSVGTIFSMWMAH